MKCGTYLAGTEECRGYHSIIPDVWDNKEYYHKVKQKSLAGFSELARES